MTAKEYLRQYGQIEREIERLLEERQRWIDLATRITPAYSNAPAGSRNSDGKIPAAVEQIIRWEDELGHRVKALITLRQEIDGVLKRLENPDYRTVLQLRYIRGMTWEKVAEEMHYSYQWVCILHGRALQALKEYITVDSN